MITVNVSHEIQNIMYTIMLRKTVLQVMALNQLVGVGCRGGLVLKRIHWFLVLIKRIQRFLVQLPASGSGCLQLTVTPDPQGTDTSGFQGHLH